MSKVKQADVVRAAIEQFERRGGFVVDVYLDSRDGIEPGPRVVAACAVGGVEQAIWRLTGDDVTDERGTAKEAQKPERGNLYTSVMAKLNRRTRRMFSHLTYESTDSPPRTVEELTFIGRRQTARRRTLEVFRAVLADLERA